MRWRRGRLAGQLEGEPGAALDAVAGVDRALGGHLERGALAEEAALAGVGALGVLPDDHEVAVGCQRSGDPGEGAQVDVEVELEPQAEEQAPLQGARRDVGGAHGRPDGPEQDGVVAAELLERRVGQHLAGAQVPVGAEVVVGGVEHHARGRHHLQRLGDHLGPDAVAADEANLVLLTSVCPVLSLFGSSGRCLVLCCCGRCRPVDRRARGPVVLAAARSARHGTPEIEKPPTGGRSEGTHRVGVCLLDNEYGDEWGRLTSASMAD